MSARNCGLPCRLAVGEDAGVQVSEEVGGISVQRAGAGRFQLGAGDPAGQHRHGDHPVPHGRLHVPDRVADEHGSFTGNAGQLPGLPGGVGGGFAVVDVIRTGRPEDAVVRVDGAAQRGEFRATRRGRQDDLPAPPGPCAQQVACLVQRR